MLKLITAVLISSFALTGCASMMDQNAYTGQSQVNDTTKGVGIGALGGAGIGALIGGRQGALIGAGIGSLTGGLIGHHMDNENAELRQRLAGTGVQVIQSGNQIQLIMSSDVTFATNQSVIQSNFMPTLDSVGIVLNKYKNNSIIVTGYTDNTGSYEHNQILSENRARSVGNYLISQGISMNRVFTNGMGERNPMASNATAQGRTQNRRVEITLKPLS